MKSTYLVFCLILTLIFCVPANAQSFEPLPMDGPGLGPAPKDKCYTSPTHYEDESIWVDITDAYAGNVHYTCVRVKIQHPSQLRSVPAQQVNQPNASFSAMSTITARGGLIAQASNAVVAINGDFVTNEKFQVIMRQSQQVRNTANGQFDVLIIDRNGNFDAIPNCTRNDYLAYWDANANNMYQAYCFGPVLIKDGRVVVSPKYDSHHMIANKHTQRMAICQLGELDYMLITCDGDAINYTYGMTVPEFAKLCETIGYQIQPEGFKMCYNLDGGNSASIFFKRPNTQGNLVYQKLNMPERERDLADMICFVSLVK